MDLLDRGAIFEGLELRRQGDGTRKMRGRFPYGKRAVLAAGGNGRRPRKEEFAPGAFRFALNDPDRNIHFLLGHSFDHPLASRKNGTLLFTDTADALVFDAILTVEIQRASWVQDFLAGFAAGLIAGISPGFRIPPPEAVPDAEETIEEDPEEGNALIRIIKEAVLFEVSAVTRPVYEETEIEERAKDRLIKPNPRVETIRRWRP